VYKLFICCSNINAHVNFYQPHFDMWNALPESEVEGLPVNVLSDCWLIWIIYMNFKFRFSNG